MGDIRCVDSNNCNVSSNNANVSGDIRYVGDRITNAGNCINNVPAQRQPVSLVAAPAAFVRLLQANYYVMIAL